ncbi:asparaginase [Thermosipho melanesiensis]|uniref:Asparaginase/glutaminase n=2 Tax=Thermosipho melanesiensis TaxID=46541 RepID=A6LLE3_THEM4|nr:asparaginase [Thermosipho melanesiensis]ABR30744.1 Asparaginase/glutaminase [Thermosipho melanesiensis BI429]APT73868.1 asparaginase [Thermosipho melanesiensis]OOC35810.1 asparaginase [Thermosipho melanesiensis]OOC38312.1 asparaginase [Thermosipho melanesiensis]OOC38773.1 asparaginase [Thermosipho melanesiensis]
MKKVVIVSTGGTIAMVKNENGVVPYEKGNLLISEIPLLKNIGVNVELMEFSNIPSPHMTPIDMWNLSKRIDGILLDRNVIGIVVTHGTDTLEETSYLLDLTLKSDKPVVCTAAMRNIGELGTDGPRNVYSSVLTVLSPQAHEMGVMVCLNDEIHAAREVTKTYTSNVATFDSPGYGPLGIVDEDNVIFFRKSLTREKILVDKIEEKIALIKTFTGDDGNLLRYAKEIGYQGIVLEGFGRGNVPPNVADAVEELVNDGIPVVVTSRCFKGRVYPVYGYKGGGAYLRKKGAIMSEHPIGQKAKIKLMVVMGKTKNIEEIRKYFEPNISRRKIFYEG